MSHVGPIIFANEIARRQLLEHGEVVTFRVSRRTTGETWWRGSRHGAKRGDVLVEEIGPADPRTEAALRPHLQLSGFPSVRAWQHAIEKLNDRMEPGYLYRVRRR